MNRMPFRDLIREAERWDSGLSWAGNHKLAWGHQHGFLRWWPHPVKHFVITVWNHVACTIYGHSHLCRNAPGELPVCCDCCRKVRPTADEEPHVINEW